MAAKGEFVREREPFSTAYAGCCCTMRESYTDNLAISLDILILRLNKINLLIFALIGRCFSEAIRCVGK